MTFRRKGSHTPSLRNTQKCRQGNLCWRRFACLVHPVQRETNLLVGEIPHARVVRDIGVEEEGSDADGDRHALSNQHSIHTRRSK